MSNLMSNSQPICIYAIPRTMDIPGNARLLTGSNPNLKVLTGKTRTVDLYEGSQKLVENLELASTICLSVNIQIPYSPNYPARSDEEIGKSFDENQTKKKQYDVIHQKLYPQPHTFEKHARLAKRVEVGNCYEMACVAFNYAKFLKKDVEICEIHKGDHTFVIIGRNKKNGDPEDYRTWGKDAVVCDPWLNSWYPISEVGKYLLKYEDMLVVQGRKITYVSSNINPRNLRIIPNGDSPDCLDSFVKKVTCCFKQK